MPIFDFFVDIYDIMAPGNLMNMLLGLLRTPEELTADRRTLHLL